MKSFKNNCKVFDGFFCCRFKTKQIDDAYSSVAEIL